MGTIYWSGIGNRQATPQAVSDLTYIAKRLAENGLELRSGGRGDCDCACQAGANGKSEIYYPRHKPQYQYGLPTLDEAYPIARQYHGCWDFLPEKYRNYFARNVHIILGKVLSEPSEFVVCWTRDGVYSPENRTQRTGGTGHAIAVAAANSIPVFNINNKIHREYVMDFLVNFNHT